MICGFSFSACIPGLSTYSRRFHPLSPLIGIDVHVLESQCGFLSIVGLLTSGWRPQALRVGRLPLMVHFTLGRGILRFRS